ncbi:MAG TPA: cell division topological specificity factor MinE [Methylococcaceae bacterium]|nr:cell division topological specificity factor MinE [Methylococcaceae bacterium]
MGLLDFFLGQKSSTASIAKERLQILVSHERAERNRPPKPDWLPKLQKELLDVVRRYVAVEQDAITVRMEQDENRDILELNIVLPDPAKNPPAPEPAPLRAQKTSRPRQKR